MKDEQQQPQPPERNRDPAHPDVIEVYVRQVEQLFDSMDPSPFNEKALDNEAEEYIVAAAKELPSGIPAALVIYIDKSVALPDGGRPLVDAIHKHFAREAQLLRWQLRRLIRRGAISLVIGLVVFGLALWGGEVLTRWLGGGRLARTLGQSLHIGGWVALWTPMQIFLYDWWPILTERRLYERLSRMPIHIVYIGTESTAATATAAAPAPRAEIAIAAEPDNGTYSLPERERQGV